MLGEIMTTVNEKTAALRAAGFTVGDRDPRLNRSFAGRYMVVEEYEKSELPTDDGRNGPWCVVGDDLDALIQQGFNYLESLS